MKSFAALIFVLACVSCAPDPIELRGQTFSTLESLPPEEPAPPPRVASSDYRVHGPYTHDNLAVFFLLQAEARTGETIYLSLEDALKAGALRIGEKGQGGQVNQLEIENTGERPIYLQAGDVVKGGKQDRTIGIDFVLPPKSGKTSVEAFCVEPGRWAARDDVGVDILNRSNAALRFSEAEAPVATKEQKLAIKGSKDQAEVWAAGKAVNGQLGYGMADFPGVDISLASSYVLATENPEVRKKCAAYAGTLVDAVKGRHGVVGMAYAINGEMNTIELYATPSLFRKLWPKLLKGASLEAIAKKTDKPLARTATSSDVTSLLDRAAKAEGRVRSLPGDMRLKAYTAAGVALFDTEKGDELLHRQVILK